ncbi:MAG: hypothetical protein J4F50_03285 [Acidimicrobiia bacterium]|nr:hypothetical protein [Acidimicrobiia bacterium]
MGAMFAAKSVVRAASALATRPRLWPTALVQLARFVPDRWWRRPPFVPLPPAELARFRSETMYGDPQVPPSPADIVVWLEWCRAQNRSAS